MGDLQKKKFYENVGNYWQNWWIYRNLENRHQTTLLLS